MNSDIFITINKTKENINKKGTLKKIFRDGIKFTVIGLCATTAFVISKFNENTSQYDFNVEGFPEIPFYAQITFFPMLIIVLGLSLDKIIIYLKKRKRLIE